MVGSDGCNGVGGGWAGDPETGELLATTGVSTLMGCDNVNVAAIGGARSVGLDDDVLVFIDEQGHELMRFERATS
ncbi:MAG TPA: META domain-containing protein [Actinomycetes bacterium]|nr:META domain-containing protein [Actinomycetes bacterium]